MVRRDLMLPAVVLLLTGFAVTFTQNFHELLGFNSWIVAIFGVVYGLVMLFTPESSPGRRRTGATVTFAGVSIAVGAAAPFMPSTAALAMLLLVWASVATLSIVWRWVQARERDTLLLGIFAALLAVVLAFGARDLPAVMGFFAGYCIIAGVFLGIAAFDRSASSDDSLAN